MPFVFIATDTFTLTFVVLSCRARGKVEFINHSPTQCLLPDRLAFLRNRNLQCPSSFVADAARVDSFVVRSVIVDPW